MPRLCFSLAYDGTGFAGSQVQRGQRTVQGVLETALATRDGAAVRAYFAGRTDTGVHAMGQVVHADVRRAEWSEEKWRYALNALLPPDVRITTVREVAGDWHARYDARWREYRYAMWNGPVVSPLTRHTCWHIRASLDLAAMRTAARYLVGEQDFASFTGDGKGVPDAVVVVNTVRTVRVADWTTARRLEPVAGVSLTFRVEANGFLPHMVRNIVGALVTVGRGEHEPDWFANLLQMRNRRFAPATAPPQGLILWRVRYDEENDGGNDDANNDDNDLFAEGGGSDT